MANLTLPTATKMSVVKSIDQHTLLAGVVIACGEMITVDTTTGKWKKADANDPNAEQLVYMATHGANINVPLTGIRRGIVDGGYDLTALSYLDKLYLSATAGRVADATTGANEKQTLTITGTPTGGTYKLSLDGVETTALAYNANAATIQAALEALSNVGAGNAAVTGSGPFTVTFTGALANTPLALLVLADNSLTGGTDPSITIAEAQSGQVSKIIGYVLPAQNGDKLLYLGD